MRANQLFVAISSLLILSFGAWAQTDAGNGVARVSFLRGDVTIQRGDSGDLTEAAINAPLVTGDRILTGPGSRAEVQFDYGHFVRLAPNAELRMQELKPERYLVALAEGTVSFSRVDDYDSEVEVNTPSISVRPARKGNYRVSVSPDGTTEITVRDGQAEIFSPNGVQRLGKGQTMLVRGDAANPEFQTVAELRRDDFDAWNRDRDQLIRKSESYKYVDRSIPGAYDLDAYGGWVNVAPYGHVWRPRVAVGWAPYRAGRWAWVDYYGWSWVSDDPWGWAPYHYGRWFNSPGVGWCWWPGGRMRHYYSPAVVGFVGFNIGSVGVGIGFGNVGWVPLAPYEPFHRWWGGGWNNWYRGGFRNNRTYVDNSVNIVNNVNITNVYRNARVNNGVTVVNGESFRRGSRVNPIRMSGESLRSGSVVRGNLPVAPDRGSLQYSGRAVNRGQVASRLEQTKDRQFYSRTTPTRGSRPNFETQRNAMEQVQQRAFGRGESPNGATGRTGSVSRGEGGSGGFGRGETAAGRGGPVDRGSTVDRGAAEAARGGSGRGSQETGRTADTGRGSTTAPQRGAALAQEPGTDRGGWRRFGEPVNRDANGAATRGRGAVNATPSGRGEATRGGSAENSGWRRFGEPVGRGNATSRSSDSATTPNAVDRGATSRTDAGRGASPDANDRGSRGNANSGRSDSNSGWRTFGRDRGSQSPASSRDTGATSSQGRGGSQDAYSRGSQSPARNSQRLESGAGRGSSSSSQERVRVSPSIVRERGGGDSGSGRGATSGSGRSGGSSGGRSAEPGGGRGATSGRGGANRSSIDSSNWRRFDGGAASGIQTFGEPAQRSASQSRTSSARSSSGGDAFSGRGSVSPSGRADTYRGASSSRSQDAFSGSSARSTPRGSGDYGARSRSSSGSVSAPAYSGRESSRGSYAAPSRSVYSGGSRSSAPTYRAPATSRGSSGGSYSRGGGGISRGSVGGSSRGGGGSVSRGGGGRGGRN